TAVADSADREVTFNRHATESAAPAGAPEYVWLLGSDSAAPARETVATSLIAPAHLAELLRLWVLPWMSEVGVPLWLGISLLWFGWTALNSYRFQSLLR